MAREAIQKFSNTESIFQFKVILNDSTPRIWRRIQVPSSYTFFDLHCAIQNAMGWSDGHLHAFYVNENHARDRITIAFPNPENDDWGVSARDERVEHIADYFGKVIKQCIYTYDFGDTWDHTILLERVVPKEHDPIYPRCIAGENACPPEDCGGVGGYDHLQAVLKKPRHADHHDMLDWLGIEDSSELDVHAFDPGEVGFEDPTKRLKEWNKGFGI